MMLGQWLESHPQSNQDLLKTLCDRYMETVMRHVGERTRQPSALAQQPPTGPQYKPVAWRLEENMISTFTMLLEVREQF